ncbi:hypothetical protein B296_00009881 [Ensete ventricosum]|uniref:Uncharacterized protein n=1 Tax=Ensete ventricosum TaxID=4639 RepID=A0A426YEA1_ENSVE|nr:hypothetical protein B296_00009881 [Ensete ventricosum]
MNEKVSRTLESLKLLHDFESIVTEELLGHVRKRYSIPPNYELHAPQLRQCTYNLFLNRFGLTLDALKAGLRFPLHPIIEDYLVWWQISPLQMVPNSSSVTAYERGALCPVLLKQLHGSISKMLIEKVTYEYEYRVALARFRARYHDLEIEEEAFANLPEDDNVEMLNEVPFDDSLDPPSV